MGTQSGESPITFNALKHHAGYIRVFIARAEVKNLPFALKEIGASQMDLYYGQLALESIYEEVIRKLADESIFECEKYNAWLAIHSGYCNVTLSDGSVWILRKSNEKQHFVHIHPGRYSPATIRVTANILKTVIACGVCLKKDVIRSTDLSSLNYVRTNILSLPTVKRIHETDSMTKIMKLLV